MTPPIPHRTCATRGFTLVEMLVSMSVLMVLSLGIVAILQGSAVVWRTHTASTETHDRASAILGQIGRDLQGLATDVGREPAERGPRPPTARLLITRDPLNNPVLVFTRHLPDELAGDLTRDSGRRPAVFDGGYLRPRGVSPAGIRALGNRAEVAYMIGPYPRYASSSALAKRVGVYISSDSAPREEMADKLLVGNLPYSLDGAQTEFRGYGLYRGLIAPPPPPAEPGEQIEPGPATSLFDDFSRASMAGHNDPAAWRRHIMGSWYFKFELVSDAVLYFGVQLPNPRADADDDDAWLPDPADSDRLDEFRFDTARGYDSRGGRPGLGFEPVKALRITITVMSRMGQPTAGTLAQPLNPGEEELILNAATSMPGNAAEHPYLLIGGATSETDPPSIAADGAESQRMEWVRFGRVSGSRVSDLTRGVRGSAENTSAFPAGTPVRWGVTRTLIIELPQTSTFAPPPGPANGPQGVVVPGFERDDRPTRESALPPPPPGFRRGGG
jgi:prepilin-type N-terminal cleavage/methylation domain-containing protein